MGMMDKITESCYKIPIDGLPWPKYYVNFINSIDTEDFSLSEKNKIITETLFKNNRGRYYKINGELEPLGEFNSIIAGIVFEDREDALVFILKWS
jgi:hypothetical protein